MTASGRALLVRAAWLGRSADARLTRRSRLRVPLVKRLASRADTKQRGAEAARRRRPLRRGHPRRRLRPRRDGQGAVRRGAPDGRGTRAGPPDGGPHRYIATQPGSDAPVAYDPCRPVTLVVNGATAPPLGDVLLREALAEVAWATGLRLDVEGATTEPVDEDRPAFQPDRYGDRWAPVLVAWSDPRAAPGLEGTVAGLAGSSMVEDRTGRRVLVTGIVVLDGPQLSGRLSTPDGRAAVRAVIMHELGHLVGLYHVDDPTQLMHPEGRPGLTALGAGDLEGLAELGRGACVPAL